MELLAWVVCSKQVCCRCKLLNAEAECSSADTAANIPVSDKYFPACINKFAVIKKVKFATIWWAPQLSKHRSLPGGPELTAS